MDKAVRVVVKVGPAVKAGRVGRVDRVVRVAKVAVLANRRPVSNLTGRNLNGNKRARMVSSAPFPFRRLTRARLLCLAGREIHDEREAHDERLVRADQEIGHRIRRLEFSLALGRAGCCGYFKQNRFAGGEHQ